MAANLVKALLALTVLGVVAILSLGYGELRGVRSCTVYDFNVGTPERMP